MCPALQAVSLLSEPPGKLHIQKPQKLNTFKVLIKENGVSLIGVIHRLLKCLIVLIIFLIFPSWWLKLHYSSTTNLITVIILFLRSSFLHNAYISERSNFLNSIIRVIFQWCVMALGYFKFESANNKRIGR